VGGSVEPRSGNIVSNVVCLPYYLKNKERKKEQWDDFVFSRRPMLPAGRKNLPQKTP
jgi:hypothetical protein